MIPLQTVAQDRQVLNLMRHRVFSKISANLNSTFKQLERALAHELHKLDLRLSSNADKEFEKRLQDLIDEYQVERKTVIAALRTINEASKSSGMSFQ